MPRQLIPSVAKWANEIGYSRAVRVGAQVWVAGTVSLDADGRIVGHGDAYAQAKRVIEIIEAALAQAGATLADVVRTRVYLRDWSAKDGAARAHREAFAVIRPASTFVVAGLVEEEVLVEMEVEALVGYTI